MIYVRYRLWQHVATCSTMWQPMQTHANPKFQFLPRIVKTSNMPALCCEMVTTCWWHMASKIATLTFSASICRTSWILC